MYNPGQLNSLQPVMREFAGDSDTPGAADNGGIVASTGGAAATILLPTAAGEALALIPGFNVNYIGEGAGLLSVQAGDGDSVYGFGQAGFFEDSPHAAAGQGAFITIVLRKQDPDTGVRLWAVTGSMA